MIGLPKEPGFTSGIPLQPRPAGCPVPLTEIQMTYWNEISTQANSLSIRLCAGAVRVLGPLNTELLRDSIDAVVRRHDSLRTRIVIVHGTPVQHIDPAREYRPEVVDLVTFSQIDIEKEARHVAQEFFEKQIDLSVGLLFEAKLLRLSDQEHVLLLALDHIVGDGFSNGILSREIWTLYDRAVKGLPSPLPQVTIQFADYAVWLLRTHAARKLKSEAHWIDRMTGAPHVTVPVDSGREEFEKPVGALLHIPFGKGLSDGLRSVARHERTLLPVVILTAFVITMARWCGQGDVSVVFVSHGRYRRHELQSMIGCLAHRMLFRISIDNAETLVDLLKRVHQEFLSGIDHHDFVPEIRPEITEVMFSWGGLATYSARWTVVHKLNTGNELRLQPFPVSQTWPVKFLPFFSDTPAGVVVTVNYRPDLLSLQTIERFGGNLRLVGEEIVRNPLARVGTLLLR